MLLVGVAVLTFSSLVYFAEKDNPKVNTLFVDNIELAYIHFYKPLYSCCGEPRRISKENFCVSCQKMNWCNHTNGRLMSKRTNKRPFHSK